MRCTTYVGDGVETHANCTQNLRVLALGCVESFARFFSISVASCEGFWCFIFEKRKCGIDSRGKKTRSYAEVKSPRASRRHTLACTFRERLSRYWISSFGVENETSLDGGGRVKRFCILICRHNVIQLIERGRNEAKYDIVYPSNGGRPNCYRVLWS